MLTWPNVKIFTPFDKTLLIMSEVTGASLARSMRPRPADEKDTDNSKTVAPAMSHLCALVCIVKTAELQRWQKEFVKKVRRSVCVYTKVC